MPRIDQLPPEESATTTDLVPLFDVETGITKRVTLAVVAEALVVAAGGVASVNGDTGVVVLNQDDIGDGTTNKQYSATEKTKLSGIATAATANDSDANLKNRANHTGTQLASTISDFSTAADARITAATGSSVQAYDADLAAIAGLTATTNNFIVSVSSAWASRTPAQVKTTLSLDQVDNTSNTTERAATRTLTNARITPRVGTVTSSATPTINTDNVDIFTITALAANITSMTTNLSGTPTDGQKLWIAITGTATRTIAWGASFEASTIALPTTTVSTDRLDVGFIWNAATSKWRCAGYI